MAATAKEEMLEEHAATLKTLTETNAMMAADCKRLNAEVIKLTAENATLKASGGGGTANGGGGGGPNREKNSAGTWCPTKKDERGRIFFKNNQDCATCGRKTTHLPRFCPSLPANKKRKREALEKQLKELGD